MPNFSAQTRQGYNGTGSSIAALTLVNFNAATYSIVTHNKDTMQRVDGILPAAIANASGGAVLTQGIISGIDTSSYTVGDILYAGASGTITKTRPSSGYITRVGYVIEAHATTGKISITLPAYALEYSWRDELGSLLVQSKNNPSAKLTENYAEGTLDYTASATTDNYAIINVQLNHDWKTNSTLYPHLHWFQNANARPNWLVKYRIQKNGEAKTTAWTNLKLDDDAFEYSSGTILQVTGNATGISTSSMGLSDIIQFRLIRDTANASTEFAGADPFSGSAPALMFDVHLVTDTRGSNLEYTK